MRHFTSKWESVLRQPLLLAVSLLVVSINVSLPASANEAATKPCKASNTVPCAPIVEAPRPTETSTHSRAGRATPDRAPSAKADAAADQAPEARRSRKSTFTFYGRNSAGTKLYLKFFSKTRNWVWPAANRVYVLPANRKQYVMRLACLRNEKICFGGSAPAVPNIYWGVGPKGDKGCSDCCYRCTGGWAARNFIR